MIVSNLPISYLPAPCSTTHTFTCTVFKHTYIYLHRVQTSNTQTWTHVNYNLLAPKSVFSDRSIFPAEFGGKALPDDLKGQLDALTAGMREALAAAELVRFIELYNSVHRMNGLIVFSISGAFDTLSGSSNS